MGAVHGMRGAVRAAATMSSTGRARAGQQRRSEGGAHLEDDAGDRGEVEAPVGVAARPGLEPGSHPVGLATATHSSGDGKLTVKIQWC